MYNIERGVWLTKCKCVQMKFNTEAYDKLYPRPEKTKKVETAVDGFTPSAESEKEEKPETVVEAESEVENGGDGTDSSVSE